MKHLRMWILVLSLCVIACWMATAYYLIHDPMEVRKIGLESRLQATSPEGLDATARKAPPYDIYYEKIIARPTLWEPLVSPPEAPDQEPDWKTILGDLKITQIIAAPNGIKAKIQQGTGNSRGQWVTTGIAYNGATVKEITEKGIVFEITQGGKTYIHSVPR